MVGVGGFAGGRGRVFEYQPRLGRLVRTVAEAGQGIELYSTRIEGDAAACRP
ncbi:hypothetical protein [Kitasatospora sp. NPDC051914]|uniref:hypothetical protein n=1 Tax=Kitasatospora sp. NPDC051914 TaxID=3154945 RepID=UPI003432995F